ncbi:MAG: DUF932 domain-containing protein [Gammaproteobacteria bacterium]|nr:DUF932 domain-containing protein [Gammaproteobacteria bacterium]
MAHELDFTTGQAAIAFRGAVPWHGLGETILPEDSIDDIRIKAGLDYDVVKTPVLYSVPVDSAYGPRKGAGTGVAISTDRCVLYRSDTGDDLSVVSDRYQVVQPREIVEFYRDLVEQYGFEIEVVGALKGGRKVWALANTHNAFQLRGNDAVKGFLLLATSYDGTMATQARFTSVRVVCNNTLTFASEQGRANVNVPHSTKFDAEKVKLDLKVGKAWALFEEQSREMTKRIVSQDESIRFFLDVYLGLDSVDKTKEYLAQEGNEKRMDKLVARLQTALFNSPGAHMESARGMLWGLVSAVTYDVDHQLPSRSQDTRLDKAWFGTGEALKNRAWDRALAMVA